MKVINQKRKYAIKVLEKLLPEIERSHDINFKNCKTCYFNSVVDQHIDKLKRAVKDE